MGNLGHAPVQVTRSLAENWAYFGLSRDGQGQWSIGQSTNNELLFGGAPSGVITNISFRLDGWGNMNIPGSFTSGSSVTATGRFFDTSDIPGEKKLLICRKP